MKLNNQAGAAVIEFAVILPLLLLLVFGIIEFGTFLYDKAVITNASREGCRAAIVHDLSATGGDREAAAQAAVNGAISFLLSYDSSTDPDPAVTLSPTTFSRGDSVTVTVDYEYGFLLIPAFITTITGPVQISGITTMRAE